MWLTGREAGYTLFEVLMAVTVMGISLAVVLSGFIKGLSTMSQLTDYVTAIYLAASKLNQVRAGVETARQGGFGEEWGGFEWELETAPVQSTLQPATTQVVIKWRDHGKPKRYVLPVSIEQE